MVENLSLITAAASGLTALFTIIFVGYQTIQDRRHNRISVQPHLSVEILTYQEGNDSYAELNLLNFGLGPAVIKSFKLFSYGNYLVDSTDPSEYLGQVDSIFESFDSQMWWNRYAFVAGQLMPQSSKKQIFYIRVEGKSLDSFENYAAFLRKFHFEIEFWSLYGERFVMTFNGKFHESKRL